MNRTVHVTISVRYICLDLTAVLKKKQKKNNTTMLMLTDDHCESSYLTLTAVKHYDVNW